MPVALVAAAERTVTGPNNHCQSEPPEVLVANGTRDGFSFAGIPRQRSPASLPDESTSQLGKERDSEANPRTIVRCKSGRWSHRQKVNMAVSCVAAATMSVYAMLENAKIVGVVVYRKTAITAAK